MVGSAVGSDQADVREAALALLALLVQHPGVVAVAKQVLSAFSGVLLSPADRAPTEPAVACLPLHACLSTAQQRKGSRPWTRFTLLWCLARLL